MNEYMGKMHSKSGDNIGDRFIFDQLFRRGAFPLYWKGKIGEHIVKLVEGATND